MCSFCLSWERWTSETLRCLLRKHLVLPFLIMMVVLQDGWHKYFLRSTLLKPSKVYHLHGCNKQSGRSGFGPITFSQTQLTNTHFQLRTVEDSSYNPCHARKATQGNTASRLHFLQQFEFIQWLCQLPHALKPKTWCVAYHWPTQIVQLWHVHAATFKRGICDITSSLSM